MPDEAIFQVARRIVAAELQHITYNELLPVLLGPKVYKEPANGLALTEYGFCKDCYMPNEVDPSTSVEFVTGAYRYVRRPLRVDLCKQDREHIQRADMF